MSLSPADLGPPSASFPWSLLQARGGRVLLHVSPEMSCHLKHTHSVNPAPPPPPSPTLNTFHLHHCHRAQNEEENRGCLLVCEWWSVECVCVLCCSDPLWDLPDTTSGHRDEGGDYLIAASDSAQIKTKVTSANKTSLLRRSRTRELPHFKAPETQIHGGSAVTFFMKSIFYVHSDNLTSVFL